MYFFLCILLVAPLDAKLISSIADGYFSNRWSFDSFDCRFVMRAGNAVTEDEAIMSGPTSDIASAAGVWIVNGDNVLYTIECEKEVVERAFAKFAREKHEETEELSGLSVPFPTRTYLSSANAMLKFSPVIRLVNIHNEGEIQRHRIRGTPFDMLRQMGPGELISPGELLRKRLEDTTLELVLHEDENKLLCLGFPEEGIRYKLDRRTGFLPVEFRRGDTESKGGGGISVYVTETKECPGGRWFPMRSVMTSSNQDGTFRVIELQVTSLTEKADPDVMQVVLPIGVQINDATNPYSAFRLKQPMTITLADLSDLLRKCAEQVKISEKDLARKLALRADATANEDNLAWLLPLFAGQPFWLLWPSTIAVE